MFYALSKPKSNDETFLNVDRNHGLTHLGKSFFDYIIRSIFSRSRKGWFVSKTLSHVIFYYINTNEIPGELLHENMIFSHMKITCYLHV